MKYRKAILCVAGVIYLTGGPAHAGPILDDGGPIYSPNRKFYAMPGEKFDSTIIFKADGRKHGSRVWEMPDWSPPCLSNDGDYLVRSYYGSNLLNAGYKPNEVMISFFKRGVLIRDVHLDELFRDLTVLSRDPSPDPEWGFVRCFGEHQLAVDTVEQRRIVFEMTTGAVVQVVPLGPKEFIGPRPRVDPEPPRAKAKPKRRRPQVRK